MVPLALTAPGLPETPELHLSVDGMTPSGPNLSHWPGNRTPTEWKADLSTGICLNYARAPIEAQRAFLGGAEAVLNDHYDTDGFLSLLAVLRPELALANEELCLAAAATGDFQAFQTWRGFAVDRIVANLQEPDTGLQGPSKDLARYRWLLENAEEILRQPETFRQLFEDELREMQEHLQHARNGGLRRQIDPVLGLAILTSERDYPRMVLNSLAGAWRVLHLRHSPDGLLVRYHDRTESWFELVTLAPPPRSDLRRLAERLHALEPQNRSRAGSTTEWVADTPNQPIPELYHGIPSQQVYGRVDRCLTATSLREAQITATVREHLAAATEPSTG